VWPSRNCSRQAAGGDPGDEREPGPERDADHDRRGGILPGAGEPPDEDEHQQGGDRRHEAAGQQRRQVTAARREKGRGHPDERRMGRSISDQRPLAKQGQRSHDPGGEADRGHPGQDDERVIGGHHRAHVRWGDRGSIWHATRTWQRDFIRLMPR
jgi:hypothetical protein